MRHAYFGKKLSRTKNERRLLFQSLIREMIKHGKIVTTKPKAKAVQPLLERLITKAKNGNNQKEREIYSVVTDRELVKKLLTDAQTRFRERSSGFTRIIKLGKRVGDGTEEVMFAFVDEALTPEMVAPGGKTPETTVGKKEPVVNTNAKNPLKLKK